MSGTKENKQDLESVQKAALKVILGGDYLNYENDKVGKFRGEEEFN